LTLMSLPVTYDAAGVVNEPGQRPHLLRLLEHVSHLVRRRHVR